MEWDMRWYQSSSQPPYLQDGRLARALPLEKQTDQGIYVTCPNGPVSYGCQMFLDWIVERSFQMRQA